MNLKNTFTLFAALAFAISLSAQGAWNYKPPFPGGPRSACVGFAIGTGAFVALGVDSNSFKRSMHVYNSTTNSWTQMESLGGATGNGLGRNVAVAFVIGSKAYAGTGQGSNPFYDDWWEYDAGTDVWTQKANFTPGGRRSAVAFALGTKGYVCGGQDVAFTLKNDLWEYDPASNTWTQKANFPGTARRLAVSFVAGGRAFVGSGDDGAFKGDFYEYNNSTNTWTAKATFPGTPRYGATAFGIGTAGYFGCGYDNTLTNRKDFWKYDQPTNTWTQINNFGGSPRANAIGFSSATVGYVACGYDGNINLDEFWEFDPTYTGITEQDANGITVNTYPNPASSEINFVFDNALLTQHHSLRITLVDLQGRIVRSENVTESTTTLTRDALPGGIYGYIVSAGEQELKAGKIIFR